MTGNDLANSPILYILIAIGLLYIIAFAIFSFIKTKKKCIELGVSEKTISDVVKATATASVVPSLAILLGFLTLAVSLGPVWPWWRLSVIGSLSYEIMAADYTAKGIGVPLADILSSTPDVFAAVMIVMTFGVIFAPLFAAVVGEKYSTGVMKAKNGTSDWGSVLSTTFYIALFAVYVPVLLFTDLPTALTMATSLFLTVVLGIAGKKVPWLNNFTMAIVLILSMASSILWVRLF